MKAVINMQLNTLTQGNVMTFSGHISIFVAYLILVYKRMLSGIQRNRQPKDDTKCSAQRQGKEETSIMGLELGHMPVTSVGCANNR
jgi:hypothetical protein